ncbi:MAG: hypothetical protein KF742_02975 [Cryobacterium sp.]|nr:hypothetical protein [Cryobacterium sp.]
MARIKLAYIGGGSSRAAGTMASLIYHGEQFQGSEVVLIDLNPEHLELVGTMATKMAKHAGIDIKFTTTTNQREGLADVDAVLTSFRPGGFESRRLDERIPLKHGVIGQETQGPGGLMMAFRSVHYFQGIIEDLKAVAPNAVIFNYTNPVNIVSQAVTMHTDAKIFSFCEGPIVFPQQVALAAGLDPEKISATMVGVNHNCWSIEATYDGQDAIPILTERWEVVKDSPKSSLINHRSLELAATFKSIPSTYFTYYYFKEQVFREMQGARRTRSEVILDSIPDYWEHYREQAMTDAPQLDPNRSRGGIHELELAIEAMGAYFNDTGARMPFNIPNTGGALPGFDEDVVVEVWGTVDRSGFHPEPLPALPHAVRGLVQNLAEYQYLAGLAAWRGTRADGIRAMAAHPLVPTLAVAKELYDEMAYAHRNYLPKGLLA